MRILVTWNLTSIPPTSQKQSTVSGKKNYVVAKTIVRIEFSLIFTDEVIPLRSSGVEKTEREKNAKEKLYVVRNIC